MICQISSLERKNSVFKPQEVQTFRVKYTLVCHSKEPKIVGNVSQLETEPTKNYLAGFYPSTFIESCFLPKI